MEFGFLIDVYQGVLALVLPVGVVGKLLAFHTVAALKELVVIAVQLVVDDAVDDHEAGVVSDNDLVHHSCVGRIVAFEDVGQLGYFGCLLAGFAACVGDTAFAASQQKQRKDDYVYPVFHL